MKIAATLLALVTCACAAPFEIKEGDRVLLLGDALLERENTYGLLETRMHEQFPNVKFTVRNLSWSGETPKGWSRASFDGPEKGWERLKEQIAEVKPTVAILGFGMAASLQEMTDRSGDQTLNPDPVRYGAEPMSAARFKKELGELMDAINERTPDKKPARFVLLSPIFHEDLRLVRPGLPDTAAHNDLLKTYAKAVTSLAVDRRAVAIDLLEDYCPRPDIRIRTLPGGIKAPSRGHIRGSRILNLSDAPLTENGIHLNDSGYRFLNACLEAALEWHHIDPETNLPDQSVWQVPEPLRATILKKNDLFFHQFRPANSTYLFGFRKHEQGKNAAEMPKFTPLIEAADAEIDALKRKNAGSAETTEKPDFTLPARQDADAVVDLKNTIRVSPGPRFQFGGKEYTSVEALKEALKNAQAAGPKKLTIEAMKEVPHGHVSAVADAAAAVGIKDVAFSADPVQPPLPLPNFTVADGFELTLWADTDLVGKPVGMNWDAAGRLWVACSPVYPQIEPGAHPHDKVVVLEDADRDGKADKTTTFATNLLIAAGVAPDFASVQSGAQSGEAVPDSSKTKPGEKPDTSKTPVAPKTPAITAAYVGSSTELVRVEDTDGDGIGDQRRIVFSGFGTEDTHHTIHTLRWGPDGRLYFNQSIYIHSHMETPWGMVRLNSGGILAYDPRTVRVEVFARGFINTWGHAWDQWGQSFATDGAGFEGVHWIIPGAMYRTYEGARRILPSISPGTYPKYCGLELIQSPLFPEDWQGNAITCDFRAHKITRFQINDLSQPREPGKEPLSGYVTKELPNPVVTSDASFRPIDVKLGPDGALYIADWTNPIINHGEVDFRDPRRDHTNGRIWRLAPKGKAALKWESLLIKKPAELAALVDSGSEWARTHARAALDRTFDFEHPLHNETAEAIQHWLDQDWEKTRRSSRLLDLYWILSPHAGDSRVLFGLAGSETPQLRAYGSRLLESIELVTAGSLMKSPDMTTELARDKNPRVRIEAMRGLAASYGRFGEKAISLILEAALNAPGGAAKQTKSEDKGTNQFNQPTFSDTADPYYGYAAWLSVNELAPQVMEWIEHVVSVKSGTAPAATDTEAKITYALQCLRSDQTSALLTKIISKQGLPKDGSGPWIELIGQAGGPGELRILLDGLLANTIPDGDNVPPLADKSLAFTNPDANRRAAAALVAAGKRGVKPANPPYGGWEFHLYPPEEARNDVIRLAGLWKQDVSPILVAQITSDVPKERLDAIFESLRTLATEKTATTLTAFLQPKLRKEIDDQMLNFGLENNSPAIRRRALTTLASFRPDIALAALRGVMEESGSDVAIWRELFSSEPFINALLKKMPELTKEQAAPALRAARELGKRGEKLVAAFTPLAGEAAVADVPVNVNALVDMTKKNGNPAEGELIYRRAALTCTVCHAIGGAGGKVGPDLGTIGASAPLDYIIESTVNPAVKVKEGFHAIAVTTKDGKTLSGTIAKETDTGLVLRDMTGAEQTVEKSNIKERTNIGSLMPPGLINTLNDREKANLFAFMSQLGKPGPFDASKSNIARTWRIFPGDQVEQVVAGKADPAKGIAVHSLVDGRVTKELLEVPLAVAGSSPTIVAAARFSTVSAAKSRLHLAGITKAWLDGAPLAIASDPNPVVDLTAGDHTLVIKLDTAAIPAHFRAEVPEARFLTE